MPLKPGTYFARTYDADGRASTDFAHVSTKQASLLAFSPVGSIQEDPLFTGAKANCVLVSDHLTMTADTFDTVADVALLASWGVSGGSVEAGQYNFAVGMELGSVKRCRVTSHVNLWAVPASAGEFPIEAARFTGLDLRGYQQMRLVLNVGGQAGLTGTILYYRYSLDGGAASTGSAANCPRTPDWCYRPAGSPRRCRTRS
jgi:hypothetical protein